jgi:hypothetical protein
MKILKAPNGKLIIGTLEDIPGCVAYINGLADTQTVKGEFDIEYEGTTEVNWDGQSTRRQNGVRIFVDEGGTEWLETELTVKDDGN